MSNPEPLWMLVERLRSIAEDSDSPIWNAYKHAADELEAALRAWDESLRTTERLSTMEIVRLFKCREYARQQILGVPAKEPAQKA